MARGKTNFGLDSREADALAGYVAGISREVVTSQHIGSVMAYVQSELMQRFEIAMDSMASKMPQSFHHVYEWGGSYHDYSTVGLPHKRLWRLFQSGSGARREVGYMFIPSKVPVPIHPTLLEANEETGRAVQAGKHVFTWKAPIMEYGIRVTVKRMRGTSALAFIGRDGEIKFRKGPFSFVPGGSQNRGSFTTFYVAWWKVEAGEIFDREIRQKIESDVVNESKLGGFLRKYKNKPKSFTIGTTYEGQRTFASARAQARKDIRQKQKEYKAKSALGRMSRYGY